MIAVDLPASYEVQEALFDRLCYLSDALLKQQIPFKLYLGLQSKMIRSDGELRDLLKTFLSEPLHAEQTDAIRTGNDTLVYRLTVDRKGADA